MFIEPGGAPKHSAKPARIVPVFTPLPNVPAHIMKTVAIWRERADRTGSSVTVIVARNHRPARPAPLSFFPAIVPHPRRRRPTQPPRIDLDFPFLLFRCVSGLVPQRNGSAPF